jgi:hypothetical protein
MNTAEFITQLSESAGADFVAVRVSGSVKLMWLDRDVKRTALYQVRVLRAATDADDASVQLPDRPTTKSQ